ncbi:MAG: ABC1 kinase family protein [Acidimicrobiia bacterium]
MPASIRRMVQVALVTIAGMTRLAGEWLKVRVLGQRRPVAPRRLRLLLESLGPTFMKLGQVLSTRPDLVSPAFEAELSKLQDAAPPVPWSEIDAEVTRSLGGPPDARFAEFVREPIAAASIGQVHAARLVDGTEVVVKVRRPGVVAQISVDLALMRRFASVITRLPAARHLDPIGLSEEFAATITAELDYMGEGRNAERIAGDFRGDDWVAIPAVIWDHTTSGVLTETRINGAKIDDRAAIVDGGLDPAAVARAFAHAYLTMVFVHRFFHADPHPGNVFVDDAGVIGFVDFGMVGSVDEPTGRGLVTVLTALVTADATRLAKALVQLGVAATADVSGLETDLTRLLERYGDVELQDLKLTELVADLMEVVRRRDLQLPSRIALLLKTVVMCEGVAARLDPAFRLIPLLVPYAARLATPAPAIQPDARDFRP